MADFRGKIEEKAALVNAELDRRLPAEDTRPRDLHKAMRYSIFAGGKRLRPVLCLAACEAIGGPPEAAIIPAIALEALHTYTLIHDDLPCMDDDGMRRGKPTCHVVFGEAAAVLAGDALLTMAFEWLSQVEAPPPHPPGRFALELALAAGSRGIIGGQLEDIHAEGARRDADMVEYIHAHKTAALLRAAARMGGIAAGAPERELHALSAYGEKLGMAFQIVDDILDETSTLEELGKSAGADHRRRKLTYVAVHGLERAKAEAERFSREAVGDIGDIEGKTETLVFLAEAMLRRTK